MVDKLKITAYGAMLLSVYHRKIRPMTILLRKSKYVSKYYYHKFISLGNIKHFSINKTLAVNAQVLALSDKTKLSQVFYVQDVYLPSQSNKSLVNGCLSL